MSFLVFLKQCNFYTITSLFFLVH